MHSCCANHRLNSQCLVTGCRSVAKLPNRAYLQFQEVAAEPTRKPVSSVNSICYVMSLTRLFFVTWLIVIFIEIISTTFKNICCCFFLERLFVRDSSTEDVHTVDQHTVSSRSVSRS